MATQSWSTPIDHSSDAGFRTWGAELQTKFLAAGLVQTADTGQINWSTVTRPATSTDAGYEIYYLNDSLFATAPIYLKIFYGTGQSLVANYAGLRVQIGTGTNGAGALTGTTSTAQAVVTLTQADINASFQSFLCVTAGFVGLVWKKGSNGTLYAAGGFVICRSVDSSGAITALGAFIYTSTGLNNPAALTFNQSLRFASTSVAYTPSINPAATVPGAQPASTVGTDTQAYLFWMLTPQVAPVFGMCVAFISEIGESSTFSATLIGTAAHTYIQTGRQLGTGWNSAVPVNQGMCMLWE